MVSIESVERGLARYIDEVFLPSFPREGMKGFAVGVAASLMVKRGGNLLRAYAKAPILQQLGLVSPDGGVDMEAVREAVLGNLPAGGLPVELPMGILLRVKAEDVEAMCQAIRKEGSL